MTHSSPSDGGRPEPRVLAEHAGPRRRVVDDHMFAVDGGGSQPTTFRLQLFTGTGLRPVAVVTQAMGDGKSLVNGAERFVEAVWKAHCPEEPQPPIWISRLLDHRAEDGGWRIAQGFRVNGFEVTGPHTVASPPKWGPGLTEEQLTRLVGTPVDVDRGSRWVPRTPPPEPLPRYTSMPALLLPAPDLREDTLACMRTPATPVDRLRWQLRPRRPRECCWYHRGDWRTATTTARAIHRSARRAGTAAEDTAVYGLGQVRALGLEGWQSEAVCSLFAEPIQPSAETGYIGGRHRALAVLHAGVHLVPVQRWSHQ